MWSYLRNTASSSSKGPKWIKIELLEPVIFIDIETSPVIRGTVHLSIEKNIICQDVTIRFDGHMKTQIKQDATVTCMKKVLASKQLLLYSQKRDQQKDMTMFSFEMPLPIGLPESVKSAQINVEYKLSVKITYYKDMNNYLLTEIIQKPILLSRLPKNEEELNNYDLSTTKFMNLCQYRIIVDKKSISLGSLLPVKIEIIPLCHGIRIKQIYVQLLERRTINEKLYQSCHFIHPASTSNYNYSRPLIKAWQEQFYYQIPTNDKVSQSTNEYSNFNINHNLIVSVLISASTGGARNITKTVTFLTDIDLLHHQTYSLVSKLPSYRNPISNEELKKLNSHRCFIDLPPAYETVAAS